MENIKKFEEFNWPWKKKEPARGEEGRPYFDPLPPRPEIADDEDFKYSIFKEDEEDLKKNWAASLDQEYDDDDDYKDENENEWEEKFEEIVDELLDSGVTSSEIRNKLARYLRNKDIGGYKK
jgi:hypothetical protein